MTTNPLKLQVFQEQIFFSTVRITLPKQGRGGSIGTGFLCQTQLDKDSSLLLLISNRHVLDNPKSPIEMSFHQATDDGKLPTLGSVVNFSSDGYDEIYFAHPDPAVDLACLNVSFLGPLGKPCYYRNVYRDMISSLAEDELLPGEEVWFVGYPENRYDVAHNLPVMRKGWVASLPRIDFNNQRQFLIDAQVHPGSSGSPVFAAIRDKYRLIGVVTATMVKDQQLKPIVNADFSLGLGIQQVLGLGIVLKAPLVLELLDYAVAEWKRKNASQG